MAEPVRVAGLLVPADLAPKIISALRDVYPIATTDRDDEAAVRAALIEWITELLVDQAEKQAELQRMTAHQKVDDQFTAYINQVRNRAKQAALTIQEAPPAVP